MQQDNTKLNIYDDWLLELDMCIEWIRCIIFLIHFSVLDKIWDHPGLIFIHQMVVTDFMQISKMNIIILLSRRSYEKAVYDIFLCFVDC